VLLKNTLFAVTFVQGLVVNLGASNCYSQDTFQYIKDYKDIQTLKT